VVGRGWSASVGAAGTAWKHSASCWWMVSSGSTRTWVGSL
jgi:hypothetical protein